MADATPAGIIEPAPDAVIPEDVWGALCVFAEARGEPYEGQVAVGEVVRRRAATRHFSSGSIVSTVCWPKQFSWLNENDAQRTRVFSVKASDPRWQIAVQAWAASERSQIVPGALWYHALSVLPWWARAEGIRHVRTVGRHAFYARDGTVKVASAGQD